MLIIAESSVTLVYSHHRSQRKVVVTYWYHFNPLLKTVQWFCILLRIKDSLFSGMLSLISLTPSPALVSLSCWQVCHITLTSLILPKHACATGPLHLLATLPRICFPLKFTWLTASFLLGLCSHVILSVKLLPHFVFFREFTTIWHHVYLIYCLLCEIDCMSFVRKKKSA